jgi:hypothetical protein
MTSCPPADQRDLSDQRDLCDQRDQDMTEASKIKI